MSVDKCEPGVVWTRESCVCTKSKPSKFFELHCLLFIFLCLLKTSLFTGDRTFDSNIEKSERGGGGFWKLLMYSKAVLPNKILEYYLFSRLPSPSKYLSNILSAEPSNYIWELLSAKIFDMSLLFHLNSFILVLIIFINP